MNYDEWPKYGYKHGWCGNPVCHTHNGAPMTREEQIELDEGLDNCIPILRLYDSIEIRNLAEHANDVY